MIKLYDVNRWVLMVLESFLIVTTCYTGVFKVIKN